MNGFPVHKWTNKDLWTDLNLCNNEVKERESVCKKHGCIYSGVENDIFYVFPVNLYLDDLRRPPRNWFIVDNVHDAIFVIKNFNTIEMISLDHDLGDDKNIGTGYDVLLYVEQAVFDGAIKNVPKILIHTANISAKEKMERAVHAIQKQAN